jgi:hypothetical protein
MSSEKNYSNDKFYDLTTTITVGQTDSAAIDLCGLELVGFFIPSNFTATSVSIQTAPTSGGIYVTAQDGYGTNYSLTVAASKYVPIHNYNVVAGLRFIKIIAGTTQASTDAVITLALRSL